MTSTPVKNYGTLSELDVIKQVLKKKNYQYAYELLASKGQSQAREISSKLKQDEQKNKLKQAQKIW